MLHREVETGQKSRAVALVAERLPRAIYSGPGLRADETPVLVELENRSSAFSAVTV